MGFFNQSGEKLETASQPSNSTAKTIIGEDTECTGEFNVAGALQIDGKVRGSILSEGTVFVGLSGMVQGDIQADKIIIGGKVDGNVICNILEIMQSGEIKGEIRSGRLVIEPGGTFIGSSQKIDGNVAAALAKKEQPQLLETPVTDAEVES